MNLTANEQFVALLKNSGERVTSPRLVVFRLLQRSSPISMRALSQKAGDDGVNFVTVYRTISLFKQLDLVREIGVGSRRLLELTDNFGGHHHHFWCSRCGKIVDFDDKPLEHVLTQAATNLGITVESHQLEIVGLCRNCSSKV